LDSKEKHGFQRLGPGIFAVLAVLRRLCMEPERRWVRAVLSAAFIVVGAMVFARSVPYYCYLHTAQQALEEGNFAVAEDSYKCALAEADRFENAGHRRAHALSELGQLYCDQCRYNESVACYESALLLEEKAKSPARERADTMLRLGIVYSKQKRYDQAHNILSKALALMNGEKDSQYDIAAIKYGLAEVAAATGDYSLAADLYGDASAIFLSLQKINTDLIASCLNRRLIVLRKLNRSDDIKAVERQLAQVKVPSAPVHLWYSLERFGYSITERLISLSEQDLRHPPAELADLASPGALHAIALCAPAMALPGASDHGPPRRISIQYVQITQPTKTGFVPVSVMVQRQSMAGTVKPVDQTFQLRYWLGLGVKTHKPMLAAFYMIGCRTHNATKETQMNRNH